MKIINGKIVDEEEKSCCSSCMKWYLKENYVHYELLNIKNISCRFKCNDENAKHVEDEKNVTILEMGPNTAAEIDQLHLQNI